MPQKTIFHSMELFAKYVMPYFTDTGEANAVGAQAK
jgi:hypothetical protein